jgi:Flp pilus assembly protein TadD
MSPRLACASASAASSRIASRNASWAGQGKRDEGIAELDRAVRLRPGHAGFRFNLANLLFEHGEPERAIAAFREAIRLEPGLAMAHSNLGFALARQGKPDEAIAELREAIRLNPADAEAHCNLGQLLQQRGEYEGALAGLRRGHELGSGRRDWRHPSAEWIRNCERMVALDSRLRAILDGQAAPADAAERLDLFPVANAKGLHAMAASFAKEAFAMDPRLATDLKTARRYNAACCAALAGCGKGKDRPPPAESERAALREQALEWLKADLAAWSELVARGESAARSRARNMLQHWEHDGDLAGVRDASALAAALPGAEQARWRNLWADVDKLLAETREPPLSRPPASPVREDSRASR